MRPPAIQNAPAKRSGPPRKRSCDQGTGYDASGQSVWTATESGDGHLVWKAEVASGIYVYLVVSADGKASKVGKLSVIR